MRTDKAALLRWIAEQFRQSPPGWPITPHSDIVILEANPAVARMLFDAR